MSDELKGIGFPDFLKYLVLVQKFAPEVAALIQRLLEAFKNEPQPRLKGASGDGHCCLEEAIKAQVESLTHLLHLRHEKESCPDCPVG